MFGKGKKKATSTSTEKPTKKAKTTKGSLRSGPGGTSDVSQTPPPVTPASTDSRFVSEAAAARYEQIRKIKIVQEKGFAVELLRAVPEIQQELSRRKWEKLNEIMLRDEKRPGNETLTREFFANSILSKHGRGVPTWRTQVRGVEINWSPNALNTFLGTTPHNPCPLVVERERLQKTAEAGRREVRDAITLPGTQWLKCGNRARPTKIQMIRFQPVARAWAEFYVKSIDCCSNSSEIQLDNAVAVKMIVEGSDFDIGKKLTSSLWAIASNDFTLGHCNLITALCQANKVPELASDTRLNSIRPLSVNQFRGYDRNVGPQPAASEEEDEELQEIDRYEDGVHPQQQQPQEVHAHPHSEDDIAALMTQLAIAEACHVPHVYYSSESTLYQEAMARRASFQPQPLYPRYSTSALLQAQHGIEQAQLTAHHVEEMERWAQDYAAYQREHFYEADLGLGESRDEGGSPHQ